MNTPVRSSRRKRTPGSSRRTKVTGQHIFISLFLSVTVIMTVYAFLSLGIFQSVRGSESPAVQTLELPVKRYSDDALERNSDGKVALTEGELHLGSEAGDPTLVGLRFAGAAIPIGASIEDAYIEFIAAQTSSVPSVFTIYGQDHDNAPTFRNRINNISGRLRTAGVSWSNVDTWNTGDMKRSVGVSPIVKQITGKDTWKSGNALVFIIEGNGTRAARAFKSTNTYAAKLRVTYSISSTVTPAPTLTPTQAANPTPSPASSVIPTGRITATPTPQSGIPMNPKGQIFMTAAELYSKPVTGAGWDLVKSTADMSSYGTVNLSDQNLKTQTHTLAGALVYARTGNSLYKDKVTATVRQVCGTENQNLLGLARTLFGYVLAADLVKMDYTTTCTNGQTWQSFLETIRTKTVGSHGRWKSLEFTSGDTAGNWGNYALPSHLAVSYALRDESAIRRDLEIFKRILGDTTSSAKPFQPTAGYRYPNTNYTVTTQSNGFTWDMSQHSANVSQSVLRGINPYSATDMRSGAIIEDTLRGDPNSVPCCTVTSSGIGYQAESLDGTFSTLQLFIANGIDLRDHQDSALKRAFDFYMKNGGPAPASQSRYLPYFINYYFGTDYSTAGGDGIHRHMGYGSWLFTR